MPTSPIEDAKYSINYYQSNNFLRPFLFTDLLENFNSIPLYLLVYKVILF